MAEPLDPLAPGTAPVAPAVTAPQDAASTSPAPAVAIAAESVVEPAAVVAEPVVAVDAKAAEPAADAKTDATATPSLLEGFGKDDKPTADAAKPDAKPAADAAKVDAAKTDAKVEAKPAESAPTAPVAVEYKFELPPVLKADDAKLASFSQILNEANLPAEIGQAAGQKLLGLHADAMQSYADHLSQEQHRVFNETRKAWNTEVMADPEIGGSGHQTAHRAIARVRDALATDPQFGDLMAARTHADGSPRLSELEEFLRVTGAGDHPVFLKMLHRAARYIDEPQAREIPANIKPAPTNGQNPNRRSIYDHPSSNRTT